MAGSFSDKTWSGTPLWQISEELEAQRKKREAEERRKATTPVAVLHIRVEAGRPCSATRIEKSFTRLAPMGSEWFLRAVGMCYQGEHFRSELTLFIPV
eukprot:76537-Amphidinium_carterae.1